MTRITIESDPDPGFFVNVGLRNVPPEHITVAGASQGAWTAMLASTYLENRNLNFVFIAVGLKHGFLYRPIKNWIDPTIAWAKR